jgi:hypothetical protein
MRINTPLLMLGWIGLLTAIRGADAGPADLWRDPDMGVDIATYACEDHAGKLCGRITRVPDGRAQTDEKNPDPAQRARPLLGLEILQGFEPVAPGRWEGGGDYGRRPGRIYVPANGDTLGDHRNRYQLVIEGDTLTISIANCRLLDCIGKSVWQRIDSNTTSVSTGGQ